MPVDAVEAGGCGCWQELGVVRGRAASRRGRRQESSGASRRRGDGAGARTRRPLTGQSTRYE